MAVHARCGHVDRSSFGTSSEVADDIDGGGGGGRVVDADLDGGGDQTS